MQVRGALSGVLEEYKKTHDGALPPEPFCTRLCNKCCGKKKNKYEVDDEDDDGGTSQKKKKKKTSDDEG